MNFMIFATGSNYKMVKGQSLFIYFTSNSSYYWDMPISISLISMLILSKFSIIIRFSAKGSILLQVMFINFFKFY